MPDRREPSRRRKASARAPKRKSPLIHATTDKLALRKHRDATLYRLLLRAWRAHMTETMKRVRGRGFELQPSYPGLLANLDLGGTRVNTLASRSGITRQAVSQRIEECERLGYVLREPDPRDGRATIVRFTPRGQLLLQNALEVVAEIEGEFEAVIGKQRMRQLKETMGLLLSKVDADGALGDDV